MKKYRYYVVNSNCADWFTNLKKAIKEIRKGLFGNELTIVYSLKNTQEPSELSFDDELMEFKNCQLQIKKEI